MLFMTQCLLFHGINARVLNSDLVWNRFRVNVFPFQKLRGGPVKGRKFLFSTGVLDLNGELESQEKGSLCV